MKLEPLYFVAKQAIKQTVSSKLLENNRACYKMHFFFLYFAFHISFNGQSDTSQFRKQWKPKVKETLFVSSFVVHIHLLFLSFFLFQFTHNKILIYKTNYSFIITYMYYIIKTYIDSSKSCQARFSRIIFVLFERYTLDIPTR